MSLTRIEQTIEAAIAQGVLPPDARPIQQTSRPWPVLLLTALGAWVAAVPILVAFAMLFGRAFEHSPVFYVFGIGFLAGAITIFRRNVDAIFLEQLAVPALLTGAVMLGIGLFRDLPMRSACALAVLIVLGVAVLSPRSWLRTLLGMVACAVFIIAFQDVHLTAISRFWIGAQVALCAWLMVQWTGANMFNDGTQAHLAAASHALMNGWVLQILIVLSVWSGATFLGAGAASDWARLHETVSAALTRTQQACSLALAVSGFLWILFRWPSARSVSIIISGVVLSALSWAIPSLGAVLLILSVCATRAQWRLAATAGAAAGWIIGAFYYQIAYPLATKAIVMVLAGAVLGVAAWIGWRRDAATASPCAPSSTWRENAGIGISALAIIAVANIGIWQKEELIRAGSPVFVELAPVDPRSLMQGDYMRLNFRMPRYSNDDRGFLETGEHVNAVAKLDSRGVAIVGKLHDGAALQADEILIELISTGSGVRVASDAWYFKEGEADRWAKARYGEFRIDAKGHALLVGLRGPDLEKL
jgi:uncharacterized membrane-anchored protein